MSSKAVIEVDHFYVRPPAAVWKALTMPELLARWCPTGDVRAQVWHQFELDMGS